ncbi:unnamed protein product [Trifolium pratense]|uniref:Uncharacterized protein n=1 Tax=Trifolium pratense TaxID=57577 RepID=A0ACB0JVC4_TRIPR|nr:unnamed protein product [Trifolium pratense]
MLIKRDVSFKVGEWVFLKLRPHRQQTVARRINQKLASRFFGPYPILEKKAVGNYTTEPELPVGLETEDEDLDEPESLLASREIREGDLLVKQWGGQ